MSCFAKWIVKTALFIEKVIREAKMQKHTHTSEAGTYETGPKKEYLIQTISDSELLNAQSVLYKLCTQCSNIYKQELNAPEVH